LKGKNHSFSFLERLPSVYERVDAEDEFGDLCEFLAQVMLEHARSAGTVGSMAATLLDAFRADQYGTTTSFPRLVATAVRTEEERSILTDLLRGLGPNDDRRVREGLQLLGTARIEVDRDGEAVSESRA
jgi:hypothetical protein